MKQPVGKILTLALTFLLLATPAWAGHRSFMWTAPTTNADGTPLTDLASYKVYTCPASPCSLTNGVLLGTVAQPATRLVAPHAKGSAFVTAVDTSGNESTESNVVPFELVAPSAPSGLSVQ